MTCNLQSYRKQNSTIILHTTPTLFIAVKNLKENNMIYILFVRTTE